MLRSEGDIKYILEKQQKIILQLEEIPHVILSDIFTTFDKHVIATVNIYYLLKLFDAKWKTAVKPI